MTIDKPTSADAPSSSGSPSSSQSYNSPSQTVNVMKKNRSDVIKTIQEIAKIDEFTINQAIEACQDSEGRYSMDQVLNIIMDENSIDQQNSQANKNGSNKADQAPGTTSSQKNTDHKSTKTRGTASSPKEKSNEYSSSSYSTGMQGMDIDDEDDDFDTISLQSTGNHTSVNQFCGSLSTSPKGLQSESSFLREDGKSPGLKNIGNTCWFNSIIQALFHLPYFRNLIISFQISKSDINKLDENQKNIILFVLELRKLFALMLKSKRKSINPNSTLRCLKKCSKYDVELFSQEDVSEFATILINLVEESFDILDKIQQESIHTLREQSTDVLIPIEISSSSVSASSSSSSSVLDSSDNSNQINLRIKNRKNPIVKLLNGDLLINRKKTEEESTSSLIEIFREVNIQMLNARNLHAGLELEWGETLIDKLTTNISQLPKSQDTNIMNKSIYQQESWVVQLPSVLFVCLNRYKFVKATQSSSKILEPFEFYPYIYLDRYMHSNRSIIKLKRQELQVLNNELQTLEEKLKSIKRYSQHTASSDNTYPLDDIMKCTLDFMSADHSDNEVFNSIKSSIPQNDIEKIEIVKNCLKGFIVQIEEKIKSLQVAIKDINNKIEKIFDVDNLKKIRYNLHSVCIHEGNATSGHFWTYVWNKQQAKWYKYNDTEVVETNWEDLYENAVGAAIINSEPGQETNQSNEINDSRHVKSNQPSAYFLVYIKSDDETLYTETKEVAPDLVKLLEEDQGKLKDQVFNLRLKQLYRECVEILRKSNAHISELNQDSTSPITDQNNQTCIEHAKAFKDSIIDCFSSSFEKLTLNKNLNADVSSNTIITIANSGLEEALNYAVETELKKYTASTIDIAIQLPDNDSRTQHILNYFTCNNVPQKLKTLALYDLFRIQIYAENNTKLKLIQILSQIKFNEFVIAALSKPTSSNNSNNSITSDLYRTYEKWQNDYRDYRSIIAAFINAANFIESQKYEEAATFFCVACEYNERITGNLTCLTKGMDHEFLLSNRRKCLKLWNQSVIGKFTQTTMPRSVSDNLGQQNRVLNQQEMTALMELMISKFLPCFFRLLNQNSTVEDRAMIDEIRQDWLGVLDSNLPELQVFHDFMTKLFEDQFVNHFHSLNVNKTMLTVRYKEAVQILKRIRIN